MPIAATPVNPVDVQLGYLIQVSWVVLIPVGVMLAVVLYKAAFLLHNVTEFVSLARYDLHPAIREFRQVMSHIEILSGKAVQSIEAIEKGAKALEKGVQAISPSLKNSAETISKSMGGLGKALMVVGTVAGTQTVNMVKLVAKLMAK
jgi:hypothetical protein